MVSLLFRASVGTPAGTSWFSALAGCLLAVLGACGKPSTTEGANACSVGSAGCACAPELACDDGLVCDEGSCHGAAVVGLSISDPNARACEVLLVETGAHVLSVDFGVEVQGTHVREAPKTALSFISQSDAPIPDGAVQVRFAEGQGAPPEVGIVHCSDKQGARLPGAKVTIRG
jgi:hypothetical protein